MYYYGLCMAGGLDRNPKDYVSSFPLGFVYAPSKTAIQKAGLKVVKEKDAKRKVMVTHMHPSGSKAEMFGFPGSIAIRKAVDKFKPEILIDAHIHEAGGMEETLGSTRVINVSRKEKIFEI